MLIKIFGWDWIMGSTALTFSLLLKVCRRYGKVRTVYSSKLYDGRLYIGTNQGLFYKEYKGNGEFKFIDGTKGVWSLFEYDGTFADMIQEHLSLKRLQSKYIRKIRNLEI
jgi:hypothetical protein